MAELSGHQGSCYSDCCVSASTLEPYALPLTLLIDKR